LHPSQQTGGPLNAENEAARQCDQSKVRAGVEHVFAVRKDTIGIPRATKIGMANLVYNMGRRPARRSGPGVLQPGGSGDIELGKAFPVEVARSAAAR
jgi:hypothetical protein